MYDPDDQKETNDECSDWGVHGVVGCWADRRGVHYDRCPPMTVHNNARTERMSIARYRCEANGLHHKDCPGVIGYHNGQFVLHHIWRRSDPTPTNLNRDDVEWLRVVWNGPTGMGAAGCHGRIHRNQTRARELGLLAPRPVHALTLTPHGWLTSTGQLIGTP